MYGYISHSKTFSYLHYHIYSHILQPLRLRGLQDLSQNKHTIIHANTGTIKL